MTKNNFDFIQQCLKTHSVLAKVKTNNVTNPLLWVLALFVILFISSWFTKLVWLMIAIGIVLIIILIFFLCMYVFFAIKDPNRLQSDECQIARLQIEMEASKYQGDIKGKQVISDPTQDLIDNAHNKES